MTVILENQIHCLLTALLFDVNNKIVASNFKFNIHYIVQLTSSVHPIGVFNYIHISGCILVSRRGCVYNYSVSVIFSDRWHGIFIVGVH
jgi:hypothetical protein